MTSDQGYRIVDHTADVIVEAWGGTRSACLEALARGFCSLFAADAVASGRHRFRILGAEENLAPLLLEEIIYVLDTSGSIPVGVHITSSTDESIEGWIDLAAQAETEIVGPGPKAISRSDAALVEAETGWTCRLTVDV